MPVDLSSYWDPIVQTYDQQLSFARQRARATAFWYICAQFLCVPILVFFCLDHPFPKWPPLGQWLLVLNLYRLMGSLSFFFRFFWYGFAYCTQDSMQFYHSIAESTSQGGFIKSGRWEFLELFLVWCPSLVMESIAIFSKRDEYKFFHCRLFFWGFLLTHLMMLCYLVSFLKACGILRRKFQGEQNYILQYYFYVMDTCKYFGTHVAETWAPDNEFFRFAFDMFRVLRREYSWLEPAAEKENRNMLMLYMYAHKRGVHFVQTYMDAEDELVQLEALTIMGCWADERFWASVGRIQPKPVLSKELYMKLEHKSANGGEVGRRALVILDTLQAL